MINYSKFNENFKNNYMQKDLSKGERKALLSSILVEIRESLGLHYLDRLPMHNTTLFLWAESNSLFLENSLPDFFKENEILLENSFSERVDKCTNKGSSINQRLDFKRKKFAFAVLQKIKDEINLSENKELTTFFERLGNLSLKSIMTKNEDERLNCLRITQQLVNNLNFDQSLKEDKENG